MNDIRKYRAQYPDVGETVMIRIDSIDLKVGAHVHLLEYNIPGMMMMTELSRKRYRSIRKLISVGMVDAYLVTLVNENKNCVDVSRRLVKKEDADAARDYWEKTKCVHNITCNVARQAEMNVEDLYLTTVWPLYDEYDHAYNAFELIAAGKLHPTNIDSRAQKLFYSIILDKLKPNSQKITAIIELACYGPGGVNAIRNAIKLCEESENNININLIASPKYEICTVTHNTEEGKQIVEKACDVLKNNILHEKGGIFSIKRSAQKINNI